MEIFRITLARHLASGKLIVLGIVIIIFFTDIMKLFDVAITRQEATLISVALFIGLLLPTALVHLNYYLVNRGDVVSFSHQGDTISLSRGKALFIVKTNEIKNIKYHVSPNKAAGRSAFLPWDTYSHAVIFLNDGNVFTITSLLGDFLEIPIEKEKVEVINNFYRLAKRRKFPI